MNQNDEIKTSDHVAQILEKLEIKHMFGIIGAGNVHLFEAIAKRGYTEIICVHHEQAACMAAQTYYRTHSKLAGVLLTTGAGSTNGVTGVVSAWADSIPLLVIAGNENSKFTKPENPLRMWGVQGYDSVHMVEKVTKYSTRVVEPELASYEIEKAFIIAAEGRPGPCWIEIPMDIQSSIINASQAYNYEHSQDTFSKSEADLLGQISSIKMALKESKRPVLWLGHGIRLSGAHNKITELLDMLQVPALVSWAGIDMVDSDHPLIYGRAGVYGQRAANFILQNSDYVLAIGTRLAIPQIGYDLTELAREARIDVVDIDPSEAKKHSSRTKLEIVCDASIFINSFLSEIKSNDVNDKKEWISQCNNYQAQYPWVDVEHDDVEDYMNSYRFMANLNKFLKDDQYIVTDMGTALLCGHQVLKLGKDQRLITSTGLGEMGYGLPGAIGVSIANDKKEVMCLNCDGGMMLNLQELQTMVHHNLPIKLFVFNNDGYLMIKHTQKSLFKSDYVGTDRSSGVSCPDFSKLATAFGIPSYQIHNWDECDDTLSKVQNTEGPVVCEVFMHPEQPFTPKLGLAMKDDGSLVSPPLEDLSPLIDRSALQEAMMIGMHEKSKSLK